MVQLSWVVVLGISLDLPFSEIILDSKENCMKLAICFVKGIVLFLVLATVSYISHTLFDLSPLYQIPLIQLYLTALVMGVCCGLYFFVLEKMKAGKWPLNGKPAIIINRCLFFWFIPVTLGLLMSICIYGVLVTTRYIATFYISSIICALPIAGFVLLVSYKTKKDRRT